MAASQTDIERLAAGAQGGTAALSAYDQGQSQVKANRDQAISQLQQSAAQAGAPGALTAQLAGNISSGAGVALNNLATLGAASSSADQSMQNAADVYQQEANQALPLIVAQDNADLSQKIAMLDAQRSHAAGSRAVKVGGLGGMTDAELKTYLLGAANLQRQGILQQATQAFNQQMAQQPETPTPQPMTTAQLQNAGMDANSPLAQAHLAREQAIHNAIQGIDEPKRQALANLQNAVYGPGITNDAITIGVQQGLDPARLAGILTPAVDAEWVRANAYEGNYTQPSPTKTDVSGQVLSPYQAGSKLLSGEQLTRQQISQSMGQRYFDWNGDSTLQSAFAKWQAAQNTNVTNQPIAQQQQAFEKDPQNQRFQRPVVSDLVANLQTAAEKGYGIDAAWARLQTDPAFQLYPREFQLALTMSQPLFDYYAALRTKAMTQQQVDAASFDPTLAPTG